MICFMCKRWHANANALIRHFKLVHGLCSGKGLKLKCAHRGCSHIYQSFSGLRKHLIKCCANDNLCFDDSECSTTNNSISLGDTDVLPTQSLPCDTVLQERNIVNSCAILLAELKVAGATINYVVSALQEVLRDIHSHTQEALKNSLALEEPIKSVVESQIDECFEKVVNPAVTMRAREWSIFLRNGGRWIQLNLFLEQDLLHDLTEQLELFYKPLSKIHLCTYQFLRR
ncbi:hypothetical protein N1851_027812 [Merluccius polli]|uniref:Uncharacterized protein n=1 Tax=Merluccius polli TaxID=89951 RepID=A0AA47M9X8_MERPO|nr:hypothetical protein N1851_027812 [Merluccius polli]